MELMAALILALGAVPAAAQENTKGTPRATMELAAYVEEHERDFERAVELYAEAELVARKAGDETTAGEAAAAKRRLEARIEGKQNEAIAGAAVGSDRQSDRRTVGVPLRVFPRNRLESPELEGLLGSCLRPLGLRHGCGSVARELAGAARHRDR